MGISVQWDASKKLISGKHHYFVLFIVLTLFFSIFPNLFYAVASSNQSLITCEVDFENPDFFDVVINNSIFTYVKMNDCISFGQTGDPVLPVYPTRILIPYGKHVIDVAVSNDPFVKIGKDLSNKPIVPQQEAFPFSKNIDEDDFLLNETVYKSQKPVFDKIYSLGDQSLCRGYNIFTVFLHPIQYIPKSGLIYYTPKITINVILEESDDTSLEKNYVFYRQSSEDNQIISNIVENPEDVSTYNNLKLDSEDAVFEFENGLCNPADTSEYVIITSNSLSDTSGYDYNWSDLVSHRQSYSGLNGTIVTVEEIDSCSDYWNQTATFNDTQAHIRQFCKDAYQDWETQYVLFGGDWDTESSHQIVPYRLFTDDLEDGDYNDMACDMYYSHLDGDWYYSGKDLWGGGIASGVNDLYGELFVGRITVSTAEHISNAVSKIIDYDTNNSLTTDWLRSVSFWGGNLGWSVTSKQYLEEIRLGTDTHRTFTGFEEYNTEHPSQQFDTSGQLYHADLGSDYITDFNDCLTNDDASVINHLDHSSWSNPFSLNNWDSITNSKPFFGYSQGCLSGRYHNQYTDESGCEMIICENPDKHAYALVLNTGYGYGSGSSTDGASQYLQAYFWDYFFNNQSGNHENWQLGKAMAYSQDKISAVIDYHSHAWCYAWYSAHLFGDPAQTLRINNSNNPSQISNQIPVDTSINVALNTSQMSVIISDSDLDNICWSIQTSPNIGNSSGVNDSLGNKICNISNLNYSTTYQWFVNVTDAVTWTNETYSFTTRSLYTPDSPSNFNSDTTRYNIQLSWVDDDEADYTLVEWNDSYDANWSIGDKNVLYNGSNQTATQQNLTPGTTRYYKAWSYNSTDNVWSNPLSINVTTNYNNAPMISLSNPDNNSIDQNLSLNWSIQITDSENDTFNYSIELSNGQSITENNSNNVTKNIMLTDLSYDATYIIWVNVSDAYNTTHNWYKFTTKTAPVITVNNTPPNITAPSPDNNSVNVATTLSSLTVLLNDSNADSLNWSVETVPNIGISSGVNESNGTKSCNVSSLSYSTSYIWFVNVSDGTNYTNRTYQFTTKSAPSPPNNPGSPSIIHTSSPPILNQNILPTADSRGPYAGYVNQSVFFDGSESNDTDGEIKSYSWDFGDGSNSFGETTSHVYLSPGNYTVKLTVTDNEDAISEDETFVEIIKNETVETGIEINSDDKVISDSDTDNDGITDDLEKEIGSNPENSEGVTPISVGEEIHYLIDSDNDGKIDLFYDSITKEFYQIVIDDKKVLIDTDHDGTWDYYYDIETQVLGKYDSLQEMQVSQKIFSFVLTNWFVVLSILLVIVGFILLAIKKKSAADYDNKITDKHEPYHIIKSYQANAFKASNQIHFVSKNKDISIFNDQKTLKSHKIRKSQKDDSEKQTLSSLRSDDEYVTSSSLKGFIGNHLGLHQKTQDTYESDHFMTQNRVDTYKTYNRDINRQIYHDSIVEKIDELIDNRFKDKIEEN